MSNTDSIIDAAPVRIILSAGDPAGIGPDLISAVIQHEFNAEIIAVADPEVLQERADSLGLPLELTEFNQQQPPQRHIPGQLKLVRLHTARPVIAGKPEAANAAYVLESIRTATRACLDKVCDAMVTAPVNKAIINTAGTPFRGHTEFIAALCGDCLPVMMLQNNHLRVILVTTHLPLKDVPFSITRELLTQVITIANHELKIREGIARPHLAVCGLNPHAGEGGFLGSEELEVIIPVLDQLRAAGLNLRGPVPADTAFTSSALETVDAVIAMYHDQGLPVLKSQGFGDSVNITLGLPIIRTSVDHGTAYALAGTGRASDTSLLAAINCAIKLANGTASTDAVQTP